jgi:transcriptional regulator with GAF, ATPase, and Fis domain
VCDEASRSKLPLFDSMGLTTETASNSGFFAVHKAKTNQKKLELIYKITDLLQQSLSKEDCLEMLLDIFFEFMVRIDRAAFILVDRQTGAITTSLSKRMKSDDKTLLSYSKEVVARVIRESKRLIISDALQEEAESELMNALAKENIASVMCLPLISFSMLVGALYVDCLKRPYPFALEDISLFEDIAQRTATYLLYKDIAPG